MSGVVDSGGGAAKEGSGEERLEVLLVSLSRSSSGWGLVRLRLTCGPRGPVTGLVFLILLSEERTLETAVLMGAGFEAFVRPAVTFLMALMPAVLPVGFEAIGLGAGSVTDGNGRAGGMAGICMVI